VLNASGHLAIVATFYEGTSLAESEKSFQKCTKYLKNCLGNTYKVSENSRKLNANGDMLKELIFRLPETKFQKPSTVTLQLWMPKEADKSHLFRVLMVFPKNGFYL
jgi:hypothetical protein